MFTVGRYIIYSHEFISDRVIRMEVTCRVAVFLAVFVPIYTLSIISERILNKPILDSYDYIVGKFFSSRLHQIKRNDEDLKTKSNDSIMTHGKFHTEPLILQYNCNFNSALV